MRITIFLLFSFTLITLAILIFVIFSSSAIKHSFLRFSN